MRPPKETRKLLKKKYLDSLPKQVPLTSKEVVNILKEFYDVYYEDKRDRANYGILCRYRGRLSGRLLIELEKLTVEGKKQRAELFRKIMNHDNPLLKILRKQ